ncbi:MAG: Gfo/Idh/MocA family oxidoreductase [Candidatus Poribacteria bacterium]|nr:Gfo/Idh/MocA family oxidoreductase [Candidatus Poribacteria bacterium]
MSQKEIRVGIIGAGGIARSRHLPNLQKIEGVDIVAVCNRTPESTAQVAADYDIPKTYSNWRELIRQKDIDAVFIATPPYLHCAITLSALEAGKHVFCQARMAMNYQEAKRMYDASQKTNLKTMLCPVPAGIRGGAMMKKLIDSGYLGKVYNIQMTGFSSQYADASRPLHWRQMPEISGLNALTLGMWAEVLHRWFGYARRVTAQTKIHLPQRRLPNSDDWAKVEIPDTIGLVAEMMNGALTVMHFSGVTRFAGDNRCEIYGSDGTVIYNLNTDEIQGAQVGNQKLQLLPIPEELQQEWTVEADFISTIRDDMPVSPSFYAGLKYMEFTEAVMRSAHEGRSVELPFNG